MNILGISAFYHDSAACLIIDGKIIAAAQEERFTRKKNDASFPTNACAFCLDFGNLDVELIDYVVFYDKPLLKFERLFETYLAFAPKGFDGFHASFSNWLKVRLYQKQNILKELKCIGKDKRINWSEKLLFSEHHLSHAASAFFPSPFQNAAILAMDGVGEWTTTSLWVGNGNKLSAQKEINFPHSLGLLYSAFTYYTGFKVNSGEYKLMGLAPYGKPKYSSIIKDHLIQIKEDGSFMLNMDYFDYCTGFKMTNNKFNELFGGAPRNAEATITQREMDLASSIQAVTEEIVLKLARSTAKNTGQKNLCLAGGVALNCVANGKLLRENIFDHIWIQPAAGDAGGCIGAALAVHYLMCENPRLIESKFDSMQGSYLGPEFTQSDIDERLARCGAIFKNYSDEDILTMTSRALADGKIIGWHSGRMEFGPRALGARSIIADPRAIDMQQKLNIKIKFRESFRPFAPSILTEDSEDYFDLKEKSPYMLLVANVAKEKCIQMTPDQVSLFGIEKLNIPRSEIPAVTHVDYSARVQTVHKETNPRYHRLISKFKALTGCPVLANTSFNIRSEPIVSTPEDAFRCFMGTDLDVLVVGNSYLKKLEQIAKNEVYVDTFEAD